MTAANGTAPKTPPVRLWNTNAYPSYYTETRKNVPLCFRLYSWRFLSVFYDFCTCGNMNEYSSYLLDDAINASHRTSRNCDSGKVICSPKRTWTTVSRGSALERALARNFCRKWSSVCLFQFLWENSFSSLWAKCLLHSYRLLLEILSSELNVLFNSRK